MRLSEISTKDGEVIELGKFTLLVGPNNVGKSQTLKDIHHKLVKGHKAETTLISSIKIDRPSTFEGLYDGLDVRVDQMNIGHHYIDSVTSDFNQNSMVRIQLESSRQKFEQSPDLDYTYLGLSKFRVFYMDSESRLKIAFQSTFGMNIKLDYSSGLELRLAVSKEFEFIPEDPRAAYPVMKKYPSIELQGDGFRSFVAVVLSLLLSKDKIVLLDEPEAFLHPEQARRLGKWISDHVEGFPCQILVATHNSNFLSGLLAGKQLADIYRLNRVDDNTRFNKITSDATQALSKSPILSSQRVLEGIFSRGVIVCESDTDRIIYNSVAVHEHGNQEILFIHAHNKQTIKDVVKLLKDASIPTAAIIDIDILNSEADLSNTIATFSSEFNKSKIISLRAELAAHIEEISEKDITETLKHNIAELLEQLNNKEHTLSGARGALNRIRSESTKWSKIKKDGINALDDTFCQKAQRIIDESLSVGMYIVPVGELEGWIRLEVRKNRWVLPALEEIHQGRCPENLKNFVGSIINDIGAL